MPLLDVSEILNDADIADIFTVKRRAETVNEFGRSVVANKLIDGVAGVVTSAGGNDLMRLPEEQRMGRNLVIVTQFRLRGPSPGYQPDVVIWYGNEFVVKQVDPYPQYGRGFMQAIVGSMDAIDSAIPPHVSAIGRFDYSDSSQSGLIQLGAL